MIEFSNGFLLMKCRIKSAIFRFFFFFIFTLLYSNQSNAQVSAYSFTQVISGYTPLTGTPTVAYPVGYDNHTTGAAYQVTMPFTFVYDDVSYTQFFISPNGFITFGATQPAPTNDGPLNNTTSYSGAISALGMDLMSNGLPGSDIEFGVVGTAPNRIMVVQWRDAVRKLDAGEFNFQIRLKETSNKVELSYGLCQPAGTTVRTAQVGLRGSSNVAAQGDVNNRIQGSSTTWFGNTLTIINNNAANVRTVYSATIGGSAYPDLGLSYEYSPAPACVAPSAQPSGLAIGSTSISDVAFVGNSFTAASPAPTNYMVLRSTTNVAPTTTDIVDGTYYPLNTVVPLTGFRVVSTSNVTSFTQTGLLPDTTYYYWVIPYNDMCTGAPLYNMTGIISANATTCSQATVASAATSVGGNDFIANWSAVPSAVDYVLDVSTNITFTALVPGYSNLSVGLVTNYAVTGLLPLTTYYYRVRAIGSGCIVNSNTITVSTTCGYYNIPYVQNFDTFATGIIPPCYTRDNVNGDTFQWQTQSINFSSASRSLHMAKNPTLDMDDWFFLPGLNLTGGVSYRLFFRYNTGNTTSFNENLKVRLGNGASVASMSYTLIDLQNINNSTFQVAIVDFIPVTSGVYYIGFQGYSIANQTYIVVDDVSVTVSPNCFEPTDVTIPVVGTNSATISWTASVPAPANGYDYYISTSNTPPTGATIPTGSVGAGITSVNAIGLLSSTYYYVWVRGNCSAVDKSVWTLEESFSTECATPLVAATIPATRCGFGTVTLNATPNSGSSINWYNSSSGGSILFNGNNFITPSLSTTTTYYAEAKAFGAVAKVGPTSPLNEGGTLGVQNFSSTINFNVTSNTTLLSLDIYPLVSGQSGQLVLRNSSNTTIATFPYTTSVAGGATPQVLNINYVFTPGNYNFYFATVPTSGIRMNTTNAFYPYISIVANIQSNTTDNTQYLGLYNWKFTTECLSTRVPVIATITSPPALSISSATSSICENTSTSLVTVTGYGAYNSLVWTPSTGISGSFASGFTFNPTTTTTYTLTANQTSGSFCGNTLTHTVTVKPAPPPIMVVPNATTICANTIQSLNGSASASAAVPIFTENFNSATNSWVVANTSVGGNTAASQWTLRPDAYNYINGFGWNVIFHSNDSSQFYLANSDAQSAVPGILTRTTLTSPSFSLAGYTSASLSYWQYIRYVANDITLVQISTDDGSTWTTIKTYIASQGTVANFSNDTINLTPYIGFTNIKLRFNYTSQWGYVWAIDNVEVTGTLAAALTWSPITDLYSDAAATIPYVAGTPLSVVYTKPTATITYTASLTGANACLTTNTTTISVVPSTVAGVASSDQLLCSGFTPSNIILTGNVGNILRWEYADDPAFTVNLTTIANTTNTLTVAQMGSFTTIRYFRAIVKNGICNQVNSNTVFVSYPSTTWNGSAWSAGLPDSTKMTIFNGNYSSTGDLSACAVVINSGTVIFNSNHTLAVDNSVSVNGGSLTFENNASLVQVNNSINTGNIVFKRITMPMTFFDYTYWSSPVTPQTLVALSPNTPSDKYFKYDTSVNDWVSVPSNSLMSSGKGYIIRAPTTFSLVTPTPFSTQFFGVPNNGTITTPIGIAPGNFNLIGNPYPSAISADSFLSFPSNVPIVDATIYLWTHNTPITANQYTSNDYAVYNYLGGVGTSSAINSGINSSIPNGKIASGQSFFIKGLNVGNATFNNAMRISGNNNQFFRINNPTTAATNQDIEKHRIWLDIVGNQGTYKQTLIGYVQNATNEIDRGFDGEFLDVGNSVTLYSLCNGTRLNIQGKALPFYVEDEVPLGFKTLAAGSFQINLYDYDGLFLNQNIYLKDNLLNTIHNIKSSPYSFVSEAGTFENRFVIVYQDTSLTNSEVQFDDNSVVLYKPDSRLIINSGITIMKEVKIYDIRGRLLMEKSNINASSTDFDLGTTNQVFIILITADDLKTVVKKYVN